MTRKGYQQEYQCRLLLEEMYGKGYVIKTSSSKNVPDYVILGKKLAYEIKSTVKKNLYLQQRDRKQWKVFKKWSEETGTTVYYWVVFRRKPKNIIKQHTMDEFHKEYMERRCVNGSNNDRN